jgi:hypothetical protein
MVTSTKFAAVNGLSKRNDRPDIGSIVRVGRNVTHKSLNDLDLIKR